MHDHSTKKLSIDSTPLITISDDFIYDNISPPFAEDHNGDIPNNPSIPNNPPIPTRRSSISISQLAWTKDFAMLVQQIPYAGSVTDSPLPPQNKTPQNKPHYPLF